MTKDERIKILSQIKTDLEMSIITKDKAGEVTAAILDSAFDDAVRKIMALAPPENNRNYVQELNEQAQSCASFMRYEIKYGTKVVSQNPSRVFVNCWFHSPADGDLPAVTHVGEATAQNKKAAKQQAAKEVLIKLDWI